jgi:hypothetical protein
MFILQLEKKLAACEFSRFRCTPNLSCPYGIGATNNNHIFRNAGNLPP